MAAGRKTGGRQRGTRNRRTEAKIALVQQYSAEGVTPLEVMLGAMREAWAGGDKAAAAAIAKDAAPYLHPKLSSVEHKGDAEHPLSFQVVSGVMRADDDDNDQPPVNGAAY